MFYLDRAVFWENTSFSLVLSVLRRPFFPGSLPILWPSSDTSEQLDTMQSIHTHTHRHVHKQQQKTNNKPAGSIFFPSCLRSVYTTNLQVLFKLCSFLQCSCRLQTHTCKQPHTYTHRLQTHLLETVLLWAPFAKKNHQHTRAYTLCFCRPPVAIRPPTALLGVTSSPRVVWCSQAPPPPSPPPSPDPQVLHVSQSV